MNLKDKVEIYNYCHVLFERYEKEYPDYIFIENYFGDEVMKIAGEKYGLLLEDVEEIYVDVQTLFIENAINKLNLICINELN